MTDAITERLTSELIEKTATDERFTEYMKSIGKEWKYSIGDRDDANVHRSLQARYPTRQILVNGKVAELLSRDEVYASYNANYESLVKIEKTGEIREYMNYKFSSRLDDTEYAFYFDQTIKKWVKFLELDKGNIDVGMQQVLDLKVNDSAIIGYRGVEGSEIGNHSIIVLRQNDGWLLMGDDRTGGYMMVLSSSEEGIMDILKFELGFYSDEAKIDELVVLQFDRA